MVSKESISVFKPQIARKLLKKGYTIVDIKAHKDNSDRSVFIFRNDEGLIEEIIKLSN